MEAYRFGKPEPCWQTLHFKPFEAYLHLSYKPVRGKEAKLNQMAEDARQFVYNHTVKAQQIQQSLIHDGDSVNGVFYELGGETASAVQFYVTDSSRHYLRGALYFKAKTNRDSLDPIIDFIKADIRKLIESLEWKEAPDYKGGDLQARP
jgi:gliding motility-associated lipoprotein GldD